jgi:hypothetical protein
MGGFDEISLDRDQQRREYTSNAVRNPQYLVPGSTNSQLVGPATRFLSAYCMVSSSEVNHEKFGCSVFTMTAKSLDEYATFVGALQKVLSVPNSDFKEEA